MKTLQNMYKATLVILSILLYQTVAVAQFDDLYYVPNKSGTSSGYNNSANNSYGNQNNYDNDAYDQYDYDGDMYDNYDDYDYQYSRRIRKFHRVNPGFGFYDPFFYDPFMNPWYNPYAFGPVWIGRPMNPWFRPGLSICYNRWNRMGSFGMGWGYSPWGFNSWGNPYMGWGYSPWGMDPFMMGYAQGFNQGYYNGGFNSWDNFGGGGNWNNQNPSGQNVVYTPRRGGSVTSSERSQVRKPMDNDVRSVEGNAGHDITARPNTGDPNQRPSVRNANSTTSEPSAAQSAARNSGANESIDQRTNRRFFNIDRNAGTENNAETRREIEADRAPRNQSPNRTAPSRGSDQDMYENRNSRNSGGFEHSRQSTPSERRDVPRASPTPRNNPSPTPAPSNRGSFDSGRSSSPSPSRSSGSGGGGFNSGSRSSGSSGGGGGRTSPRG
jgi:hypothetical protein